MHYIVAPTMSRAAHYAAALGLNGTEWKPLSRSKAADDGDQIHVLPGVSHGLQFTGTVIDHRR